MCAVDTSEAGIGDVDVTVTCSSGHVVVKRQKIDEFRQNFSFVPSIATNHDVIVTFNKQHVTGIYNRCDLIYGVSQKKRPPLPALF